MQSRRWEDTICFVYDHVSHDSNAHSQYPSFVENTTGDRRPVYTRESVITTIYCVSLKLRNKI